MLVLATALAGAVAPARADEAAAALTEKMFATIGGRAAWAAARSTINVSTQHRAEEPTTVRVTITIDFVQPRFRIETQGRDLHLVRGVDGERHWRLTRAGTIEPLPEAMLQEDRRWHAAHIYRTLHRIAARDPALALKVDAAGRLEVREGQQRLIWLALDARGEPFAFGAHDDEAGTVFGPWLPNAAGLPHPAWVTRPDGRWRAVLERLVVNPELQPDWFARPEAGAAAARTNGPSPAPLPWFVVTLARGPGWDTTLTAQAQAGFAEHSANLTRLRQSGRLLLGGRTTEHGVMLLAAASAAEARAEFDRDPMVARAVFAIDVQAFAPFHRGSTGGVGAAVLGP